MRLAKPSSAAKADVQFRSLIYGERHGAMKSPAAHKRVRNAVIYVTQARQKRTNTPINFLSVAC